MWTAASLALMPALVVALLAAGHGAMAGRLAAVQLASSIVVLVLLALTFVDDQSSSIDLALATTLLALPANLLFAVFAERWL